MDAARFAPFDRACAQELPKAVADILEAWKGEEPPTIGFITTDDFYGCFLAWGERNDITNYFSWRDAAYPDFLYRSLVDVAEASQDIDLLQPSEEKWAFALAFLETLAKNLRLLSEELFRQRGWHREEITFFAAQSDGDYVRELLDESLKVLNK